MIDLFPGLLCSSVHFQGVISNMLLWMRRPFFFLPVLYSLKNFGSASWLLWSTLICDYVEIVFFFLLPIFKDNFSQYANPGWQLFIFRLCLDIIWWFLLSMLLMYYLKVFIYSHFCMFCWHYFFIGSGVVFIWLIALFISIISVCFQCFIFMFNLSSIIEDFLFKLLMLAFTLWTALPRS